MGESACLMQPFSYAAAPQGDSLGALGQSVSFGRFMSEKLDWEKWSSFSTQNPYVAEAERYSRPGSVAQKKAFFEAHYKNLAAARKAAAQEAALLLQQQDDIKARGVKDELVSEPDLEETTLLAEKATIYGNIQSDEKENLEKADSNINGKDSTSPEQMEKTPQLLKKKSQKDRQPKSSGKPRRVSSSKYNSWEKTPSRNKSNSYTSFTPVKEFSRLVSIIRKIDGSRASSRPTTKDCKTPLSTPSNKVSAKGDAGDSLSTPLSSNKRALDSSAKTGRGRWNFLHSETTSCFTPFGLRTEERAERRKKKLEEKFKGMEETHKQKQEEKSVRKEESKIGQRLCFKAKPLPNFYKSTDDQTKNV